MNPSSLSDSRDDAFAAQAPRPLGVVTPEQFVGVMRELRQWSGLSFRQLERRAEQAGEALPRATLAGALGRADLPREELVAAFVKACGGDADDVVAWVTARKAVAVRSARTPGPVPSESLELPEVLEPTQVVEPASAGRVATAAVTPSRPSAQSGVSGEATASTATGPGPAGSTGGQEAPPARAGEDTQRPASVEPLGAAASGPGRGVSRVTLRTAAPVRRTVAAVTLAVAVVVVTAVVLGIEGRTDGGGHGAAEPSTAPTVTGPAIATSPSVSVGEGVGSAPGPVSATPTGNDGAAVPVATTTPSARRSASTAGTASGPGPGGGSTGRSVPAVPPAPQPMPVRTSPPEVAPPPLPTATAPATSPPSTSGGWPTQFSTGGASPSGPASEDPCWDSAPGCNDGVHHG